MATKDNVEARKSRELGRSSLTSQELANKQISNKEDVKKETFLSKATDTDVLLRAGAALAALASGEGGIAAGLGGLAVKRASDEKSRDNQERQEGIDKETDDFINTKQASEHQLLSLAASHPDVFSKLDGLDKAVGGVYGLRESLQDKVSTQKDREAAGVMLQTLDGITDPEIRRKTIESAFTLYGFEEPSEGYFDDLASRDLDVSDFHKIRVGTDVDSQIKAMSYLYAEGEPTPERTLEAIQMLQSVKTQASIKDEREVRDGQRFDEIMTQVFLAKMQPEYAGKELWEIMDAVIPAEDKPFVMRYGTEAGEYIGDEGRRDMDDYIEGKKTDILAQLQEANQNLVANNPGIEDPREIPGWQSEQQMLDMATGMAVREWGKSIAVGRELSRAEVEQINNFAVDLVTGSMGLPASLVNPDYAQRVATAEVDRLSREAVEVEGLTSKAEIQNYIIMGLMEFSRTLGTTSDKDATPTEVTPEQSAAEAEGTDNDAFLTSGVNKAGEGIAEAGKTLVEVGKKSFQDLFGGMIDDAE